MFGDLFVNSVSFVHTAVAFIVVLTILVLIHELGHFFVARFIGVDVEEFGLGLPPRIWGKKIGAVMYSVNWLPIGGFVKLAGEDEDDESRKGLTQKNAKHFFWARSKKERSAILLAGVTMNFLLAVGITTFLLGQGVMEPSGRIHVDTVSAGSPAQVAGIHVKDYLRTLTIPTADVTDKELKKPSDLIDTVKQYAGQKIIVSVQRSGQSLTVEMVPRIDPPVGQGPMGVAISDLELKTYPFPDAPKEALRINLSRAKEMFTSLGTLIFRLITLQPLQADVAGPVGIAQVTGEAVKYGWRAVLEFMSILSLNLAVLNVLPFPALDGGRLAFVFLEKVFGRKFRPAFERTTHQIGMLILFGLIILVTIHDIMRKVNGG
jgi:regulator of sigma E protease